MSALPLPPELPDLLAAPAPLRVLAADGTLHFSDAKKLALSPRQYLHSVNSESEPTSAMLLGTLVHFLVLGTQRHGAKPLVRFAGDARRGKAWEAFAEEHAKAEILTAPEWAKGEAIAEAVLADPVARERLEGARFEVPLTWEDVGIRCSTSGVDIVTTTCALGDLKTTTTTHPDTWRKQAFRMLYPQQLAWYRRGAAANGIDIKGGLFLLGVETKPPFEVVDLELTDAMIDFADRTISLWLEKLRVLIESCPEPRSLRDWPGYAQATVPWDVPSWMTFDDEEEEADA